MMNNTKKINVNFSSLVGLKAELLKKQHEVNEAKLKSETIYSIPKLQKKKSSKIEYKNENLKKSEYIEDVDTHKKSKLMLAAKTRLYDQLKKSKTTNENFLVDFTNKSDESEEELLQKDEENDAILENEDDWVEYEDCFGRTRKCLREDLCLMQEKDQLIKQQIINKKGIDPKTNNIIEQNYAQEEKEPEIEIMRRKWEEQTKKLTDKVNIHYQDILFDEARTHGVGYYAFSQDEEERIKQQENLFNLRKETERKQKEIKELKELKEKMEYNRLKAAKIRQRIRAGLPIDAVEEEFRKKNNESNQNTSDNIHIAEKNLIEVKEKKSNENQNIEINKELERENKIKVLGEFLGKRTHWYEMSQEEWIHKCRKIRVNEFGPVYKNFKSAGYLNSENINVALRIHNDEEFHPCEMNIQSNTKINNEVNIDTYNIPLPPNLIINDPNIEHNNLTKTANQNSFTQQVHLKQQESNNILQNQMIPNRNIDEASIAAGLKYLREKFEKSQNT